MTYDFSNSLIQETNKALLGVLCFLNKAVAKIIGHRANFLSITYFSPYLVQEL